MVAKDGVVAPKMAVGVGDAVEMDVVVGGDAAGDGDLLVTSGMTCGDCDAGKPGSDGDVLSRKVGRGLLQSP